MTIVLNGQEEESRGAKTIAELIERFQLPPQTILVEHNGLALHRHEWPQRPLAENDRIELIRVVAGG
jgi:thiamine biosynthesis protein ThiS